MNKIVLPFLSLLVIISLNGCATSSECLDEPTHTQQTCTVTLTLQPTAVLTEQPIPESMTTPSTESTPKPPAKPTQVPATPRPTTEPTAQPTAKPTPKPSGASKPTVVQRANPDTGISWDGVSPIIYIYHDGTTGTEKRLGAKYEAYPGVIYTIEKADVATPTPSSADSDACSHCGKTMGDGTNGTCVRYSMLNKDMICLSCGETIPARTCHTCK